MGDHRDFRDDGSSIDEEHTDCIVLIVDDDEALCHLIQKNLQSEGLHTRCALNGAEAVEQATQDSDALLLLDYRLPDMTGKQLIELLNSRQNSNPFIVMTAYGDERVAVEMMKMGARDYLVKDAEFLDLLPVVVRQVMEQLRTEKMLLKAKEALQESKEKLRDSVLENRVIRSEKLAALGRLSANLVHELSNPLDGTRRFMRLMLNEMPQDDPVRLYAEHVKEGLARMSGMIGGLADFARRSKQVSTPTDTIHSIKTILSEFENQMFIQKITVKTEFDESVPVVFNADVNQIFENIVRNAVQAMKDGGMLHIKAGMISPDMFEARFSDTGPGIPDDIRDRIFEPFFTTKGVGQGVGLGLSISQGIAESYNGSIAVESTPGNGGATFVVTLPMSDNEFDSIDTET